MNLQEIVSLRLSGQMIDAYYKLIAMECCGTLREQFQYYDELLTNAWYTNDEQIRKDVYKRVTQWFQESKTPIPREHITRMHSNIRLYNQVDTRPTIAIYCMHSFKWDTTTKALNGSEEAVVYLGKELAQLGYKIFVFSNPPEDSADRLPSANPQYQYVSEFDSHKYFDILVIWRQYDKNHLSAKAGKTYLWVHDVLYKNELSDEKLVGIDGILWLSHFQHFDALTKIPSLITKELDKGFSIYGNGIVREQFSGLKGKKSKSCIYASSYIRGLEMLLTCWPEIKKAVPEATLNIYYGWQTWLHSESIQMVLAHIKQMLADYKDLNVTENGAVDHETLSRKFLESEYWLYPCVYPETYCITAIKAQASECIPVCFDYAALRETVKTGYKCSKLFDSKEYTKLAIKALQGDYNEQNAQSASAREELLNNHSWKDVAHRWHKTFGESK